MSGSCRGHHSLVWESDLPGSAEGLLMPRIRCMAPSLLTEIAEIAREEGV